MINELPTYDVTELPFDEVIVLESGVTPVTVLRAQRETISATLGARLDANQQRRQLSMALIDLVLDAEYEEAQALAQAILRSYGLSAPLLAKQMAEWEWPRG